jgi:hypothetical protein
MKSKIPLAAHARNSGAGVVLSQVNYVGPHRLGLKAHRQSRLSAYAPESMVIDFRV